MPSRRTNRGKTKKKGKTAPKTQKQNPQDMLAQVQGMQTEMAKAQEELENEFVSVSYGGGAVTIEISGHQRVKSIEINPELIDPEEIDMLQDMLVGAVNTAIEQSQTMSAERMEGITGGMGGGLESMLGNLGLGL